MYSVQHVGARAEGLMGESVPIATVGQQVMTDTSLLIWIALGHDIALFFLPCPIYKENCMVLY